MSGRAGRRGKDDKGICIMMLDDQLDEAGAKGIIMVSGGQGHHHGQWGPPAGRREGVASASCQVMSVKAGQKAQGLRGVELLQW